MGRVINTDGPGKRRNNQIRTVAEILRRLSQKPDIDRDAKDMIAHLVYSLQEIDETIDESALAWEKRDYWMKAEEFRMKWQWAAEIADELRAVVLNDSWEKVPASMAKLFPYVADIKISKYMRSESTWSGSYNQLIKDSQR